jgi:hypothetical protein
VQQVEAMVTSPARVANFATDVGECLYDAAVLNVERLRATSGDGRAPTRPVSAQLLSCLLLCALGCEAAPPQSKAGVDPAAANSTPVVSASAEPGSAVTTGARFSAAESSSSPAVSTPTVSTLPVSDVPTAHAPTVGSPLETLLLRYAASCTSRSKRYVLDKHWQGAAVASDSLSVVFPAPRSVLLGTSPREADALLVPRSGPFANSVLARSGKSIYSPYTQCDDQLLLAL